MSWFLDDIDDDEREGTEMAEGVLVERRDVIKLSLGAIAALSLGWPMRALAEEGIKAPLKGEDPTGDMTWEMLLKKVVPMAEHLVKAKKPNEEAFLFQVAAFAARLKDAPAPQFKGDRPVAAARLYRKLPFVALQFRLKPGAAIPFHDHREYIGVLNAMSGDAKVRSFDLVDQKRPAKNATFTIRETRNDILRTGGISTLSRTRDNIHDVRAGKDGARLLDFFAFFSGKGSSVYLNVEDKPKDPEKGIYEATWKV